MYLIYSFIFDKFKNDIAKEEIILLLIYNKGGISCIPLENLKIAYFPS